MKVVFPCKGAVVLTKKDADILKSFYETTLSTSKMAEIYEQTEYTVQVGNFNYLPPNSTILIEDESQLLTISKLRSILNGSIVSNPSKKKGNLAEEKENTISDDSLLSHPFFQTLKPLD